MKFTEALALSAAWLPLAMSNEMGCITEVVDGQDYFPNKVTPVESQKWSVSYENTYKIVTNSAAGETYLLYQCGSEPPQDQMDGHAAVIAVPVEGVGLASTTMIPFVELLGAREKIKAYFGSANWISSPCLSQLHDEGKLEEVLDPNNATKITNVDLDLPSFIGHFSDTAFENDIKISLTEEDENLAQFEWVKYYSLFFNLEETANTLFDNVKGSYECAEQNAAELACDAGHTPTVLWGSYSSYCEGWDVARCPNYYCEFAEACQADILNSEEGSIQSTKCGRNYMTTEEFVAFGKDADHWIYTSSDFDSVYATNQAVLDEFVSVKNQTVYDTEGNGAFAWFEQRIAEPDVILQDFCNVVGRENVDIPNPHQRAWLRNVFTEAVGSLGQCTDTSAPLETQVTECVALPADYCADGGDAAFGCTAFGASIVLPIVAAML